MQLSCTFVHLFQQTTLRFHNINTSYVPSTHNLSVPFWKCWSELLVMLIPCLSEMNWALWMHKHQRWYTALQATGCCVNLKIRCFTGARSRQQQRWATVRPVTGCRLMTEQWWLTAVPASYAGSCSLCLQPYPHHFLFHLLFATAHTYIKSAAAGLDSKENLSVTF